MATAMSTISGRCSEPREAEPVFFRHGRTQY